MKCPTDLWVYQEIVYETKPDLIVECGTAEGGTALFLATVCDALDRGRVLTIDLWPNKWKHNPLIRRKHNRITYHYADDVHEPERFMNKLVNAHERIMVILDSDHKYDHVIKQLDIYSKYVSPGCYLIVEDTNLNGHPVVPNYGAGPMEAVREFLSNNKEFVIDKEREKLLLTFNPCGYLKRVG
jgi:cephalosporin hydroxylase